MNLNSNTLTSFTTNLIRSAREHPKTLVFPEAHDPRVAHAIAYLLQQKAVKNILIGCSIEDVLAGLRHESQNSQELPPGVTNKTPDVIEAHRNDLVEFEGCLPSLPMVLQTFLIDLAARKNKPMTAAKAQHLATSKLYQGGYLLTSGYADACIAGSLSPTADVIRAAIGTVGLKPDIQCLSGGFLMNRNDEFYLFADAAINIEPSCNELVAIAAGSVNTWRSLFPDVAARVAFLSFSTKGSAKHAMSAKMAEATQLFCSTYPDVLCDGELQVDAALDAATSALKSPHSALKGNANILIFPNLDAGNIAYKIAQRLGGFSAIGPLFQGIHRPYYDLSRGTNWQDIVTTSLVALSM